MALDSSVVTKGARDASVTLSSFPAPVYIDIVPPTGSTSGGTSVTIGGSHFSGATGVTIGGVALTSFTVVSDTQITGVTGAHGAGAVDVVITGRVGSATGAAAYTYASGFDPATLSPTGWWRASYAGAPWAGQGSAGNLNASGSAPAVGAAVNGLTPASFDGATTALAHASDFDSFVSAGAGTVLCILKATAAAAPAAATYNDPGVVTSGNGDFSLGFSSSGIGVALYDGVSWKQQRVACATGGWHLAKITWDGATLSIGLDGGAMTTLACGSYVPNAGSKLTLGEVLISATAFFTGQILEVLLKGAVLTGTDIDNYRGYANSRYGISV